MSEIGAANAEPVPAHGHLEVVARFPASEPIVGLLEFKGRCLVATALGLYELIDKNLIPLEITTIS